MRRIGYLLALLWLCLAATFPAHASFGDSVKQFGQKLGLVEQAPQFLEPDQAFIFSAEAIDGNTLRARFEIVDGYYLYRDKFQFSLRDAEGLSLGDAISPPGKLKQDEYFGEMQVYYKQAEFILPVVRDKGTDAIPVTVQARFQGCADAGLCYPPTTSSISLTLPEAGATVAAQGLLQSAPLSEQDRLAETLASGSKLWTVATFFGLGLLLAFTPCVFPMIPILSSIIVGQGEQITARKGFILSLVYVLAMAVTYTIAGVFAGLFGENLQAAFQNPWILGSFSAVFAALALSMFGFYDLQLPGSLQSRISELSNRQEGGTLVGTAIMGFLSALIVGPCVAPPLAGALIYIGQSGDALLGGSALFALSLGMGAPLLAIGASAGKLLPRAGDWMQNIKAVFGVLLLAVAVWMLERIIPESLTLALWAALLIGSSIYMGALEPVGRDSTGWRKLWKGVGLIMLIYGSLLLIGAASGAKDPLQPLHGIGFAATAETGKKQELHFTRVKTVGDLERELAAARANQQPVMLDYYADWCASCKEMERYTFSDPGVQSALSGFRLLQADVTLNDEADAALLKRYGLIGPPSILFFDRSGQELRHLRLVGFLNAESFRKHATTLK